MSGSAQVIHANARHLPLSDDSVDLVVTSPPYFALRSYQDGCATCAGSGRALMRGYMERYCPGCSRVFTSGRNKCHKCNLTTLRTDATKEAPNADCPDCNGTGRGHYPGQVGDEPTPAAFVASLLEVTRECVRVLKPSGSLWVNLGDKYVAHPAGNKTANLHANGTRALGYQSGDHANKTGLRTKSLIGIPWRYALACIDDLGIILRAEVVWSKPNGLPESVTDRVRRSHETWFHFVLNPRYYSAVDEIREPHSENSSPQTRREVLPSGAASHLRNALGNGSAMHPLGKLPGSVWTIPTEPLTVPDSLGVDHFAAFPTEFPRRIIAGWSPAGVCTACGEGRRPVVEKGEYRFVTGAYKAAATTAGYETGRTTNGQGASSLGRERDTTIVGETCSCDSDGYLTAQGIPLPQTQPAVILDPFGGTGTTALVAKALGRHGISVDMSGDYCRLATWRTTNPNQLAKAARVVRSDAARAADHLDIDALFEMDV